MKVSRDQWGRALAAAGCLVCLAGAGFTAWRVSEGLRTGVITGKYGARYLRAEGDVFYYSTVTLNVVGCALWLALTAFAVLVMTRWRDWT